MLNRSELPRLRTLKHLLRVFCNCKLVVRENSSGIFGVLAVQTSVLGWALIDMSVFDRHDVNFTDYRLQV
jgi:hypothetical protein